MTTPQPDYQYRASHRPDEGAAMDTFTVGVPRWLVVLFSRNPLIRMSDRVEALALVLTVVVSLLTMPIAAAVGTAVYDSRSRLYAEQAQTQTQVTATVIDRSVTNTAPGMSARDEAVAVALAIWLNVTAAAVALFAGARVILNRARHVRWQSDFVQLVGGGSGHTNRP